MLYGQPGLSGTYTNGDFGSGGYRFDHSVSTYPGAEVAGLGDIDADGHDDLFYTLGEFGRSGIIAFGPPASGRSFSVSIHSGSYPSSVDGLGDFNGDGIDDFAVTATGSGTTSAYVVFGRAGGFTGSGANISQIAGLTLLGNAGRYSISSAGDFNGDGFNDLVIGERHVSATASAYVVYGGPSLPASIDLANLTADQGVKITGAGSEIVVAGGGDMNGDGLDDIALTGSQGTFVVYGERPAGTADAAGTRTITGTAGNDTLIGNRLASDRIFGLGGDDVLLGLSLDDVLDGGAGADRMDGGRGNDIYYVDNAADQVIEEGGAGSDTVYAQASWVLTDGAAVEFLRANMGSTSPINLTGNSLAQSIYGNDAANILRGGDGNDIITGLGGNDFLNGDGGNDLLIGGAGNDTYYVDQFDSLVEGAGEGTDRVAASTSFVLSAGVEVEQLEAATLSSTTRLDLTGNELVQTIIGNAGTNVVYALAGNDTVHGLGGDDYLIGGDGSDALFGGMGNDTFYVLTADDAANDRIYENEGEGTDRIATAVSYGLAAGVSVEVLEAVNSTGGEAIDLSGNELANAIAGNAGSNVIYGNDGNDVLSGYAGSDSLYGGNGDDVLNGGAGGDRMEGGAGSDKYYVDDPADVIIEPVGPGDDVVAVGFSYTLSEGIDIERLEPITFASTDALNFTGNEFGNYVIGNNGANVINGGLGADVLEGLGGADFFLFDTGLGNGNIDRINDYLSSFDRFMLDDAVFQGLARGGLAPGAFNTGSAASDADDRILYDPGTGALYFDPDGTGSTAAVQFATIGTGLTLSAGDFLVI